MSRQYRHRLDGYRVPRVTSIIPDGYEGAPEDCMQEGRDRGKFVHAASVLWDKGNLDQGSVPPQWLGFVDAWARASLELQLSHLKGWTERPSFSEIYGFAGQPDRVSLVGGRLTPTIIDLKTGDFSGSKIEALWGLQSAGYEILWREVAGVPKGRVDRLVVQLHSDGRFTPFPLKDPSDAAAFKSFCAAHKWKMNKGLV